MKGKKVYLVIEVSEKGDRYGVFSSRAEAENWSRSRFNNCIISDFIVDEPEYGNAKIN